MGRPFSISIKTILFVSSSLIVGFGIYKMKQANLAELGTSPNPAVPMAADPKPKATGTTEGSSKAPDVTGAEMPAAENGFEWFPSAQDAVMEFASLSEKIFPNPDEQMRKSEILMNADLLRNVTDYLLTGNDSDLKDQAIDILVEALKLGSPDAAAQAERIIADDQIENSRLPASVRQSMAETKGEILSEFAALGEQQEAKVPGLLPGRVSQKIWAHVQEFQEQNLSESQKELGERK